MAQLRLIALPLVLCTIGEAAPAAKIAPPKGWLVDDKLSAIAASAVAADKISVLGSAAWSEPSRGCFAVFLDLGAAATADDIVAAIATDKVQTRDVVKTIDAVTLGFEQAPYRGKLSAKIAGGEVRALACMWNQREPKACEAGCARLLGSL